jgi:hypothetical protein
MIWGTIMKREFDTLSQLPTRRVEVEAAPLADIPDLLQRTAVEIPALAASRGAVLRVQERNPESIWAFRRGGTVVGIYAMLLLNTAGLEQLLAGTLAFADPPSDCLSEPHERVAAIYKWAVVARGLAAEGIHAMSRHLQGEPYATANLYARAIGAAAQRLDFNLGFRPIRPGSDMLVYVRMRNRAHPSPIAA